MPRIWQGAASCLIAVGLPMAVLISSLVGSTQPAVESAVFATSGSTTSPAVIRFEDAVGLLTEGGPHFAEIPPIAANKWGHARRSRVVAVSVADIVSQLHGDEVVIELSPDLVVSLVGQGPPMPGAGSFDVLVWCVRGG